MGLLDAGNGNKIQAFVLSKGYINLETGVIVGVEGASCVSDGDIIITWPDGTDDTISCIQGDQFVIENAVSIEVDSGKFHLLKK